VILSFYSKSLLIAYFPPLDGRKERVAFDKITSRITKLCYGLDMNFVDPVEIAQKVRF
jgi:ribonucleoside-diphosphate reductase subunit M1